MKKSILLLSLLLLLLVSCQREEEVDMVLPQKSKLVAILFIGTGDQSVVASVTRSTPVIGTTKPIDPTYVKNANGTISHGSEKYFFHYDSSFFSYNADLGSTMITSGETYTVEFSDDKETVKGSVMVPYPVDATVTMTLDSVIELGAPTLKAHFTCTSKSDGTHYIQLLPIMVYSDSSRSAMIDLFSGHKIPALQKGQSFTQSFSPSFSSDIVYPVRIEVTLLACDESFAKYYNTTNGFDYSTLAGSFGEPKLAYSNMSNGIGVIASYAISGTISFDMP